MPIFRFIFIDVIFRKGDEWLGENFIEQLKNHGALTSMTKLIKKYALERER